MEDARHDPRTHEAIRWLVKLSDEDASERDRQRFAQWLAENPDNQAAWQRASDLWSRLDVLVADRAQPDQVSSIISPGRRWPWLSARAKLGNETRPGNTWGTITSVAAVLMFAALYACSHPELFADYRTAIAQRQMVTLSDGSWVELGSATAISISFDSDGRRLRLFEGEVFFKVAPDPSRPFIVEAAGGQTTAVGTAFDVKESGHVVTVSVAEHAVRVLSGDGTSVTVAEGQQVKYGPQGLEHVHASDPAAVEAWRQDRLVFEDARLGDVTAELERYRHGHIVLDGRVSKIPVTAVFNTRQTDDALQTIAAILPVRVLKITNLLVLIYPRSDPSKPAAVSSTRR